MTRRRRLALAVCGALALVAAAPAAAGDDARGSGGFIAAIDDLPLMPGLDEDTGAGLVFDKPAGRIVEAYARGRVAADAVAAFYAETLPQLGWRPAGGLAFTREGERLRIAVEDADGEVTVRFSLAPE